MDQAVIYVINFGTNTANSLPLPLWGLSSIVLGEGIGDIYIYILDIVRK